MRTVTLCIALFCLNFTAQAAQWNRGPDVPKEVLDQYAALNFDGMPYRLLLPEGYTSSESYPLLVSMHGGHGVGDDNESQMLHWTANFVNGAWRTDFKCVTICPQANVPWYQDNDRIDKAFAIIDKVREDYSIDENRIYIIGHSGGAFGAWEMLSRKPDRFAAAITSAGGIAPEKCSIFKDVPIWNFHGDADKTIPVKYSRAIFYEMVRIGGNLKYSELPGKGHGSSWTSFARKGTNNDGPYPTQFASAQTDTTTSRQWDWLFSQSKTGGGGSEEIAALNETLKGINDRFKNVDLAFEYVGPAVQKVGTHVWGTSPVVGPEGRIHLFVAQWPIPGGEGATKEKKRGGFKGYYTTSEVAHYAGHSPEGPFEFVRMIAEDKDGGFNAPHNPTIRHIDGKYALCFIVNENDDRGTQRIVMYVADDVNGEFRSAQGGEVDGTVLRAPSDPGIWNHGSVRGVANPSLIKYDGEYRIYFKSAMPAPEKGVEGFYNREFGYGVATSKNLEGPYTIHPERLTSKEVELEDAYVFAHSDKVYMISRDIEASKGSKEGGLLWVSEDGYEFPEEKVQRSFEGLAAYKGAGEWQDYTLYRGSKEGQLERPQLLQHDGEIYLYTATGASTGPGFGSGSHILKMKFE